MEWTGDGPCLRRRQRASSSSTSRISTGFISRTPPPKPEAFDVLCGWHVLEHVANPLGLLEDRHRSRGRAGLPDSGLRSVRIGGSSVSATPAHERPIIRAGPRGQFPPGSIPGHSCTQAGFQTLANWSHLTASSGEATASWRYLLRPRSGRTAPPLWPRNPEHDLRLSIRTSTTSSASSASDRADSALAIRRPPTLGARHAKQGQRVAGVSSGLRS